MKSLLWAGALALVAAGPLAAQERSVARRQYTFLDNNLTIEVLADMPGTLRIVRGENGLLDVAGRVPGGVTAFALGGREENNLRLTAAGGDEADFIVVVPEDAYVRVRLPGRKGGTLGATRPSGSFAWGGALPVKSSEPVVWPQPAGSVIAHSAMRAPRMLSVPALTTVRTLTLKIEGRDFKVGGDRYMRVLNGSSQNVEVRTGDEAQDLEITVPADTREFTLKLAGRTALTIRDNEVRSYCEPATEQIMSGARWFTFAPEAGRLSCR